MKVISSALFLSSLLVAVGAFVPQPTRHAGVTTLEMGYVPDGMSAEEYRQLKAREKASESKKKFAALGPQTFKSRSLQSFQTELEKGKTGHLMPVFNAKQQIKAGKLKQEDIPYMQRGGSWDNSDVKSAKKKQWSNLDKKYNANPTPAKMDWLGTVERRGPQQQKQAVAAGKKDQQQKPKKKLFGMF